MPDPTTATPVAQPPPATAPDTSPVTHPSPSPTTKSWMEALDALDVPDTPVKPEPPKPEKKADPKPTAEKPAEKAAETPQKPPEPSGDKTPVGQDGVPQFRTNKELNKWARERHAAAMAAEAKRAELENRLKQLETVVPKSQQDGQLLAQQIAQAEQRIAQYEQVLEAQAFEHSAKYQKEFAEPYYRAREAAYKDVAEMMVSEPTGEKDAEEKPVMRQRPATKADFDKIYSLPRPQARALAKQIFGDDDGSDVMDHRKRISELAEKAQEAVKDRQQNFTKYRQQEMAQRSQQEIAIQSLWKTANERISADPKRAMYWGEDKEDPEANKALASGFKLADEFFSEKRDQMGPEEKVEFDAYIRHTIAMGPKLAYKVNKLNAENKALKDEIAQLRGSAPGAPKPIGEETQQKPKGLFDKLNELSD